MDALTIRVRWYSVASLVGLFSVALCVVVGILVVWGLLLIAAVLAGLWVLMMFGTRIVVNPVDVVLCQKGLARSRSVPRDAIRAMHWWSSTFTLVDDDHNILLKIGNANWTRGQLLDLSEALGVHLYNHRKLHGFGSDVTKGQLMQRAAGVR